MEKNRNMLKIFKFLIPKQGGNRYINTYKQSSNDVKTVKNSFFNELQIIKDADLKKIPFKIWAIIIITFIFAVILFLITAKLML